MPTYAYRCASCSHEFDAIQKFSDAALTTCPECGNEIRRVFHPVGIVFKGSGWYINDSRGSEKASSSAKAPTDAAPGTDDATGKAATASTSTEPAAKPAATTPAPASAD